VPANPLARYVAVVALVAVAVAVDLIKPWEGPILLTILPSHGIDAADLLALPFLLLAARVLGGDRSSGSRRWSAVSAMVLGGLLFAVGGARLAGVDEELGRGLDLVALVLLGAVVWNLLAWTACPPPRFGERSGRGWVLIGMLGAGLVVDVLVRPSGTVFGVILLLVGLALVVRSRVTVGVALVLASGFLVANAFSLTDIAGVDVTMSKDQGGAARSAALGLALVVAGIDAWWSSRTAPASDPPVSLA